MIRPKYHCAQNVLYTILDLAWDNFDTHILRFTAYKGGYTAATSAAGRALIDTAAALPGEDARGEMAETLRIEMVPIGKGCTDLFQKLKGYIRSSWAENVWKPKFEAAGQPYYRAATNNDWESVKQLNQEMKNFIAANSATLATDLNANANMPAGFVTDVDNAKLAFETKYTAFLAASNTETATVAKITADNAAFDAVTPMFADAQAIFSNEPEIAKLFVFENLQQMVDPQTQGIRAWVLNEETNVWEEDVQVTIQKAGDPPSVMMTNANGRFLKIQSQAGPHTVRLEKVGFITIEIVEDFKVGTVIRRKYVLKKQL